MEELLEEVEALRARNAQLEHAAAQLATARRKMQELAALYHVAVATGHQLEAEMLFERLYDEVQTLMFPDCFDVLLYDANQEKVQIAFVRDHGQEVTEVQGLWRSLDEAGLSGWVLRKGRSLLVRDLQEELLPIKPRNVVKEMRSWLGVPLVARGEIAGVLAIQSFSAHAFSPADQQFLEAACSQIALALQNTRLFRDIQRRAEELEVLRRASLQLTASLKLNAVLEAVAEAAYDLLDEIQSVNIFLYEAEELIFGAANIKGEFQKAPISEPRPDGLTRTVARSGQIIVVEDMQRHTLFQGMPPSWHGAIVGFPLKIGQRVVGVMNVSYVTVRSLPQQELHLLSLLSDHAAVAIENARLHELVAQQARTDALTALPNRRALNERIESEVQRASRYGTTFALLMMDLDGFKQVNDVYGHPVGDVVLQEIARLLDSGTRGSDFLARYGGDEFALLLPEADAQRACEVANKVNHLVRHYPLTVDSDTIPPLSLSVGIALFPADAESGATLLEQADQSLYNVKRDKSSASSRASGAP